jgi:hypothetical protein
MVAPLSAVMLIGVLCTVEERFSAVTTTSSTLAFDKGAVCADAEPQAANAAMLAAREVFRIKRNFFEFFMPRPNLPCPHVTLHYHLARKWAGGTITDLSKDLSVSDTSRYSFSVCRGAAGSKEEVLF